MVPGLVTDQVAVHQIDDRSLVSAYGSTRAIGFVVGKERIHGIQLGRSGGAADISGQIDGTAAHRLRIVISLNRTVASQDTAHHGDPRITHIHGSATHGFTVHQAAAVQGIIHTVGVDGSAASDFILIGGIGKLRGCFALHHGHSVKGHMAMAVAEEHMIHITRCDRHIHLTGEDGLLRQFPRLQHRVSVQVREGSGFKKIVYSFIFCQSDISCLRRYVVDTCAVVLLPAESSVDFHVRWNHEGILTLVKHGRSGIRTPYTRFVDTGAEQDLKFRILFGPSLLTHAPDIFQRIVQMAQ